jgi:transcriptional antiterminator RfaH
VEVHERSGAARWYAIHTRPKQEGRADSNLRAWSVETFTPFIKERRCTPTGNVKYQLKPLFPQYIFARFDASSMLHKIYFTRGVHDVVRFGKDAPTPIDDEIIAIIHSQVGTSGFIELGEEFKAGDRIVIKDGPLKNFIGIFEREVKESDRVMILLNTLKYQAHLLLDRELVKKIN